MSFELKFILSQIFIIIPFIAGTAGRGSIKDTDSLSKKLIRFNLIVLTPPFTFWSVWGLELRGEAAFLPIAGLAIVTAGFLMGLGLNKIIRLKEKSRKVFVINSSLANHGFTMGGFLCYFFLGEAGLGYASIFLIYFMPFIFLFMFPWAAGNKSRGLMNNIKDFIKDPQNLPLYSSVAAVILQISGIRRPEFKFPLAAFLISSMVLYYYTLGISFNLKGFRIISRESLLLAAQKFILMPLACAVILSFTGFASSIKGVIIIQSFMPAAIYSVVASILYGLDNRLASELFVSNTVFFIIVVLPLLFLFKSSIPGLQ